MEVALLVGAGGLGAGALVVWSSALAPLLPLTVPYQLDLVPDRRLLGIGLALTAVTGFAFAMPAVWRVLRDLPEAASLSRACSAAGRSTAMSALVVTQVALSTVLVVGCGLLLRSAWNTQRIDQGFDAPYGASLRMSFPQAWGDDPDRAGAAVDRLLDGLRAESFVSAASLSTRRPGSVSGRAEVRLAGSALVGPEAPVETQINAVTGDYFETLGIPVRAGRVFGRADVAAGARVAVVSQALAADHFPGRSPMGQTLRLQGEEQSRRIVGVVGDTAELDVRLPPRPMVYVPYRQSSPDGAYVTIRTRSGGADGPAALRRRAGGLDPAIALSEAGTFADLRRAATRESRVHAGLAGTAAGLALVLALVGLYGLMGYVVRQREREIGYPHRARRHPGPRLRPRRGARLPAHRSRPRPRPRGQRRGRSAAVAAALRRRDDRSHDARGRARPLPRGGVPRVPRTRPVRHARRPHRRPSGGVGRRPCSGPRRVRTIGRDADVSRAPAGAGAMSKDACIRMRVSILTPKAFSRRNAMFPDRSDRPLRNADRAGRETPSTVAAPPTLRPSGAMTSVFTNSPGWGGFIILIRVAPQW